MSSAIKKIKMETNELKNLSDDNLIFILQNKEEYDEKIVQNSEQIWSERYFNDEDRKMASM